MSDEQLAFVEMIKIAPSMAEAAKVLQQCPYYILCSYHDDFLNACHAMGFEFGKDYICTVMALCAATRDAKGKVKDDIEHSLEAMAEHMHRIGYPPNAQQKTRIEHEGE